MDDLVANNIANCRIIWKPNGCWSKIKGFQNCLKAKDAQYTRLREHLKIQRTPNTSTNTNKKIKIPKYKYKDTQHTKLKEHLTQVWVLLLS